VPDGLPSDKAVCLVCNYLTAHVAMHETAKVQPGERALIHGAAGGVGSALLHLGSVAELEMYGTASPRNHDLLRSLGATPIDYHTEDFVARVREMSGGGADVVFDPVGGARHVRRSYRALRKGGRLVWFGVAATKKHGLRSILYTLAAIGSLKVFPAGRSAPVMGDLGKIATNDGWYQKTLASLFELAASGRIDPIVAARFPLEEASAAHELLARGGHAGKVVLTT
jgi:NADPH2:quinone reductase